jgi:hypothetical protein
MKSNTSNNRSNQSYFSVALDSDYLSSKLKESEVLMKVVNQVNGPISFGIVLIGLLSNFFVILIYRQSKSRTNPSHVYLLCAAINDSLFLVVHQFEHVFKIIKDAYSLEDSSLFDFLNFIDKSEFACKLFNYLRYVLRLNSAFFVTVLTLQRLYVVYYPLSNKFKSKKLALKQIILISVISACSNGWVPVYFHLQDEAYCDILANFKLQYFIFSWVYACLIIVIPSVIICISNSYIIRRTIKQNKTKKNELIKTECTKTTIGAKNFNLNGAVQATKNTKVKLKPYYMTKTQLVRKNTNVTNLMSTRKLTKNLILISFSFVLFNFPFLTVWIVYFFHTAFSPLDQIQHNQVVSALRLTELFYLFNYGMKFFILWFTGSLFRNMFKNMSKSDIFYYFILFILSFIFYLILIIFNLRFNTLQ